MDSMSPSDAEVALRSLRRRYGKVTAAVDEEDLDDLAHRAGPDGRSVIDHLREVVGTLSVFDRALELVLTTEDPVLHPGVADAGSRDFAGDVGHQSLSLDDWLLDLELSAERFADRLRRTRASEWTREGRVAGSDTSVRAIDLVRNAVDEAVERIDAVERTLNAVRGEA